MSRRKSKPADGIVEPENMGGNADIGNSGEASSATASDSGAGIAVASNTIDPANVGNGGDGSNDGGTVKRKRGRPPGSGNTTKAVPADINGIERLLYSIHSMASILIAPEMTMDGPECREVAGAITAVNRHYNVKLLDQKTADWLHLAQVVGVAYFGRIMAIRERRKQSATVIPFPRAQSHNPVPGNPAPPMGHNGGPPLMAEDIPGFTRPNGSGARQGEIAGLGVVEFPPDHELAPKGTH